MTAQQLRKFRGKQVRIRLHPVVGDNVSGVVIAVYTFENSSAVLSIRTPKGPASFDVRAIKSVTELKAPKLKAGE